MLTHDYCIKNVSRTSDKTQREPCWNCEINRLCACDCADLLTLKAVCTPPECWFLDKPALAQKATTRIARVANLHFRDRAHAFYSAAGPRNTIR